MKDLCNISNSRDSNYMTDSEPKLKCVDNNTFAEQILSSFCSLKD